MASNEVQGFFGDRAAAVKTKTNMRGADYMFQSAHADMTRALRDYTEATEGARQAVSAASRYHGLGRRRAM
jgi:hypothetical protein